MIKKVKKPVGIYFISIHLYFCYINIVETIIKTIYPEFNLTILQWQNFIDLSILLQMALLIASFLPYFLVFGFLKLHNKFLSFAIAAMFISQMIIFHEDVSLTLTCLTSIFTLCSFLYLNSYKFSARCSEYSKFQSNRKNILINHGKKMNRSIFFFYILIFYFIADTSYSHILVLISNIYNKYNIKDEYSTITNNSELNFFLMSESKYTSDNEKLIQNAIHKYSLYKIFGKQYCNILEIDPDLIKNIENFQKEEAFIDKIEKNLKYSFDLFDIDYSFNRNVIRIYSLEAHYLIFIILFILFFAVLKISYLHSIQIKPNTGKLEIADKLIMPLQKIFNNKKVFLGESTLITGNKLYISLSHLHLFLTRKKKKFFYIIRHEIFHLMTYYSFFNPFFINVSTFISIILCAFILLPITSQFTSYNLLNFAVIIVLYSLGFLLFKFFNKFQKDYRKYAEHLADLYAYECFKNSASIDISKIFISPRNFISYHPSHSERQLFVKYNITNLPVTLFVNSNFIYLICVGVKIHILPSEHLALPSEYLTISYLILLVFLLNNYSIFKLLFTYNINTRDKTYSPHFLIGIGSVLFLILLLKSMLNIGYIIYFIYLCLFYITWLIKLKKSNKSPTVYSESIGNLKMKVEKMLVSPQKRIYNFILLNGRVFTVFCIVNVGIAWIIYLILIIALLFVFDLSVTLIVLFFIQTFMLILLLKNIIRTNVIGIILEGIVFILHVFSLSLLNIILKAQKHDTLIDYYISSKTLFWSDLYSHLFDTNFIAEALLNSYALIIIISLIYLIRLLSIKKKLYFVET